MNTFHTSVLLREINTLLQIKNGKRYIDGTLGGGGHAAEIIEHGGIVLGIDVDEDALQYVEARCKEPSVKGRIGNNLFLAKGNFKDIDSIARKNGFTSVAGVLLDLGVSSHQFDEAERGFSLQKEGPLDMRMDQELNVKASDLVNILTKGELYDLFHKLGEERFARAITNSIIRTRRVKAITTTKELAEIVSRVVPAYQVKINPATRIFQALRIAVNDELNSLREVLPKAIKLLEPNGRIAVISFHSLEDRIVKHQFRDWEAAGIGKTVTPKPITPSLEEIESNKRSRSAKLRVFEKESNI